MVSVATAVQNMSGSDCCQNKRVGTNFQNQKGNNFTFLSHFEKKLLAQSRRRRDKEEGQRQWEKGRGTSSEGNLFYHNYFITRRYEQPEFSTGMGSFMAHLVRCTCGIAPRKERRGGGGEGSLINTYLEVTACVLYQGVSGKRR